MPERSTGPPVPPVGAPTQAPARSRADGADAPQMALAGHASSASHPTAAQGQRQFTRQEVALLWVTLLAWLAVFVAGTLIDSSPYRSRFATLDGNLLAVARDGFVVVLTYTLTNVGLLCVLGSTLGSLGARAGLGPDGAGPHEHDSSAPASSAVLRGFFVYATVLAGVIVFADRPVDPTQTQYVRLAGLTSLFAFTINYHPSQFGNLLRKAGDLIGKQ